MGAAISGIVLAGGDSRRMGRDKRTVALGDRPLLEIAIDLVASVSDDVVVSCRRRNCPDIASYTGRAVELAFDERDGGPLAGMEAALSAARHELVVVVPVDMPGLTAPMLTTLVQAAEDRPAAQGAVFLIESALQPFPGAYRRSISPIVSAQLDAGALRVHDLLSKLDVVCVLPPLGMDVSRSFLNVNTAEDLERANDESR
jgi:molybdopterin-guanine dinucleotide biosynthesis protein A